MVFDLNKFGMGLTPHMHNLTVIGNNVKINPDIRFTGTQGIKTFPLLIDKLQTKKFTSCWRGGLSKE